MAAIALADFEDITDSLGIQYALLLDLALTDEAEDLAAAAVLNLARIDALADIDAQVQLLDAFNAQKKLATTPYATASALFGTAVNRLASNTGAFGTYLTAEGGYVSKNFKDLLTALNSALDVKHVYPPAVVILATFSITGSGTGTFGASSIIDRLVYGATRCEVEVTTDIGSIATVNLTMVKQDGTTEVKAVVLAADKVVGDKIDIGTTNDKYVDCTGITVNSGSDTGAIKVQNKLIRTPAP